MRRSASLGSGALRRDLDAAFAADALAAAGRLQDDAGLARRLDEERAGQDEHGPPFGFERHADRISGEAGMVFRLLLDFDRFHGAGLDAGLALRAFSWSMTALSPLIEMASTGHSGTHVSQPTQSSASTLTTSFSAMILPFSNGGWRFRTIGDLLPLF